MTHTKSRIFNRLRALPGSRMAAAFFALALTLSISALTACGSPGGGGTQSDINVRITSNLPSGFPGSTLEFEAEVTGSGNISPYVYWEIDNGAALNPDTTISRETGVLTIAADEEVGNSITLRAIAQSNLDQYATATVTIIARPFDVEDVEITPVYPYSARVARGEYAVFQAVVITNPPNHVDSTGAFLWLPIAYGIAGDASDQVGLPQNQIRINVSNTVPNEDRQITLRAVSSEDFRVVGDITITVPRPVVQNVAISHLGLPEILPAIGSLQFTPVVTGLYNPPNGVTWHISGYDPNGTTAISQTGVLTVWAEEAKGTEIRVWAVSTFDTSAESNYIDITVLEMPDIEVQSVTVSTIPPQSSPQSIHRGTSVTFAAVAAFVPSPYAPPPPPPHQFTWSVTGGQYTDAAAFSAVIGANTVFTVPPNETPGTTLTISAAFTIGTYSFEPSGTFQITVLEPVAQSVTVTAPEGTNASRGGNLPLNATVSGLGHPNQGVTWALLEPAQGDVAADEGTRVTGTSNPFTLEIDPDQEPGYIRVQATSNIANNPSDIIRIYVRAPHATGVTIVPNSARVVRGGEFNFNYVTATVTGPYGIPEQGVTWSFADNSPTSPGGSTITPEGLLNVGENESAIPLVVFANSIDRGEGGINIGIGTGTFSVNIPQATGVTIDPPTGKVRRGGYHAFTATVTGLFEPQQGVTWLLVTSSAYSFIDAQTGVLTIGSAEPQTSLTVQATANGPGNINTGVGNLVVYLRPTVTSFQIHSDYGLGGVDRNNSRQFRLINIAGHGDPTADDITVTWSIYGGVPANAQAMPATIRSDISAGGILSVHRQEPLQVAEIIIRATANEYPYASNTLNVPVTGQIVAGAWQSIRAGIDHVVGITWEGQLWTWGNNARGQLGLGDTTNRSEPYEVTGTFSGDYWVYASGGWGHTVALRDDGTIWGAGGMWRTPANNPNTATVWLAGQDNRGNFNLNQISPYSDWVEITATHSSIFGIREDAQGNRTLWAWGVNLHGMLGLGLDATQDVLEPRRVLLRGTLDTEGNFVRDADGNPVLNTATAYTVAALAASTTALPEEYQPEWRFISAAQEHALALTTDGRLFAWGNNASGRLGTTGAENITASASSPRQILYTEGWENRVWASISAANQWSAAITSGGDLYTWGNNANLRLGSGTININRHVPERINPANTWFSAISMNNTPQGAAIDTAGRLWTWGNNDNGQLGRGTTGGPNTIGLVTQGRIQGSGGVNDYTLVEFPIFDGQGASSVPRTWIDSVTAGQYVLAIDSNGSLWAWGHNAFGQLGLGDTIGRNRPQEVTAGPPPMDAATQQAALQQLLQQRRARGR